MMQTANREQGTQEPTREELMERVRDEWIPGCGRMLDFPDVRGTRNAGVGAQLYGKDNEYIAAVRKPFGMDERAFRTAVRKTALGMEPRPAYIVFDPGARWPRVKREDLPGGFYESPATDDEFLADGVLHDDWREARLREAQEHDAKWRAYMGDSYRPNPLPGCDR